jgi:hypothetical protein
VAQAVNDFQQNDLLAQASPANQAQPNEIVRVVLARTGFVLDYRDAPAEAGGWGETVVTAAVAMRYSGVQGRTRGRCAA